jgi:hypothetical protein
MSTKESNNQAGKGDAPRNCFSRKYRENYDFINWRNKISIENEKEYVEKVKNESELSISSNNPIN